MSVSSSTRRGMAWHELVLLLRDEIAGRIHCGAQTVILIDDVHRAQSDMAPFLRLLTALNAGGSSASSRGKLTVVVTTDRPLTNGLSLESLLQIQLTPLNSTESADFIRALAKRCRLPAGCLDEGAIRAIHDMCLGNTARMSRVCELITVLLEASPEIQVTAETISAVMRELVPRAVA